MDRRQIRKIHSKIAPIIFLPLFLTALTGVSYRLATSWLGADGGDLQFLLNIHQGQYLGEALSPFYVMLNALGVIAMLFTGISMTGIFRKKPTEK